MTDIRSFTEELINWWLSYTMAQPITFDLSIIGLFAIQYIGLGVIIRMVREKFLLRFNEEINGRVHLNNDEQSFIKAA
jgi:hypothetical protein